ncbi:hypothetical protein QWY93_03790 [Echinicola jeungdonensis]|uniref:Uncharacterized protein n=1 Tax=Echinicola jeungdonensis TaxID=709343 RepID=A0ABV5J1B4_9BACT|nr:hypothetical protein [Echinicola jeungdonensis]MDN3668448.1 hypothetical protein [Echinicola jeungdonensis]
MERNVLILIAIPLPAFAFAYLYTNSDNMDLDIPAVPESINSFLLGLISAVILIQWVRFQKGIKKLKKTEVALENKLKGYNKLTVQRYWFLFWAGLFCAGGLLIFQNPGFTISYAIILVFISLGKPSPDRLVKLLQLKGDDKDKVMEFNVRD